MSAFNPRRTDDEVRESIISAAQSCESALVCEAECFAAADFLNAAIAADVSEWDSYRAFAMAGRWA